MARERRQEQDTNRRRIRCAECGRVVVERDAEREGWRYWSDGTGELLPFCAEVLATRVRHVKGAMRGP